MSNVRPHKNDPIMIFRALCLSAIHFALWRTSAVAAYGSDLDQVRSRSGLANSAASLCAVLQYPHDTILRALPISWLVELPQIAGAVVLLNSLAWGVALSVVWQLLLARKRATNVSKSSASGVS
jgi:hypothetical protein